MSEFNDNLHYLEEDIAPISDKEDWLVGYASEQVELIEQYLAKHMDFARFCIAKAYETGDIEELREWGEDFEVELSEAA